MLHFGGRLCTYFGLSGHDCPKVFGPRLWLFPTFERGRWHICPSCELLSLQVFRYCVILHTLCMTRCTLLQPPPQLISLLRLKRCRLSSYQLSPCQSSSLPAAPGPFVNPDVLLDPPRTQLQKKTFLCASLTPPGSSAEGPLGVQLGGHLFCPGTHGFVVLKHWHKQAPRVSGVTCAAPAAGTEQGQEVRC